MVQTRSQSRKTAETPVAAAATATKKTTMVHSIEFIQSLVNGKTTPVITSIDPSTPFTSNSELLEYVKFLGSMPSHYPRVSTVHTFLQKLIYKSSDMDIMKNSEFLKRAVVSRVVHFSESHYSTFSEFLLPLFEHIHRINRHKTTKPYPINLDNCSSDDALAIVVDYSLRFCEQDESLYQSLVAALYSPVTGRIDLSAYNRMVNLILKD